MRRLALKTLPRHFGSAKGLPNFEADAYTNEQLVQQVNNQYVDISKTGIKTLYLSLKKYGFSKYLQKVD